MFSVFTIVITSRLMGHFFVHSLQPTQLSTLVFKRSIGGLSQSDAFVHITIKEAIVATTKRAQTIYLITLSFLFFTSLLLIIAKQLPQLLVKLRDRLTSLTETLVIKMRKLPNCHQQHLTIKLNQKHSTFALFCHLLIFQHFSTSSRR